MAQSGKWGTTQRNPNAKIVVWLKTNALETDGR